MGALIWGAIILRFGFLKGIGLGRAPRRANFLPIKLRSFSFGNGIFCMANFFDARCAKQLIEYTLHGILDLYELINYITR